MASIIGKLKVNWLAARRDVPGLVKLLDDKDYRVHDLAAQSLGSLKDSHAVEPLANAFKNGNCGAAEALGKIGDPQAVSPVLAVLKDQIGKVFEAQAILEDLERNNKDAPLSTMLLKAQKDNGMEISKYAIRALVQILGRDRAIDAFLAAMKDSDPAMANSFKGIF